MKQAIPATKNEDSASNNMVTYEVNCWLFQTEGADLQRKGLVFSLIFPRVSRTMQFLEKYLFNQQNTVLEHFGTGRLGGLVS